VPSDGHNAAAICRPDYVQPPGVACGCSDPRLVQVSPPDPVGVIFFLRDVAAFSAP
jgi:hypothetical protein